MLSKPTEYSNHLSDMYIFELLNTNNLVNIKTNSKILKMYFELDSFVKNNNYGKKIEIGLEKIVEGVRSKVVDTSSDLGYCMKLIISDKDVTNLLQFTPGHNDILSYKKELRLSFLVDWEIPLEGRNVMYGNDYYHLLLLFVLYGIKNNNDNIAKLALQLIMYRLWNGRLNVGFPKMCDPDIMKYVVSNMTKKHKARHHDNPFDLINNHYAPTVLTKYKTSTILDPIIGLKTIFNQSYIRLRQTFISTPKVDTDTGKNVQTGGLQIKYYKAAELGNRFSKSSASSTDINITDLLSSNSMDDKIDSIVSSMILAKKEYEPSFLSFLNDQTEIKKDTLLFITQDIHNYKYEELIKEIISLIFKQLNIKKISKNDILSKRFVPEIIKRTVISSKHTPVIIDIKKLCFELLNELFIAKYNKSLSNFEPESDDSKIPTLKMTVRIKKLINAVIFIFAYNIQQTYN